MVLAFGLASDSVPFCFLCSDLFIAGIYHYTHRNVFGSVKVYFICGFCIGFRLLVSFYSQYYGTSRMQRCSNSWRVRNLHVMVLRLNRLAESIMSLHTMLLRPGTNSPSVLQYILHSSHVINNAREDPFPLPQIFMPKEAHLRQLVT